MEGGGDMRLTAYKVWEIGKYRNIKFVMKDMRLTAYEVWEDGKIP